MSKIRANELSPFSSDGVAIGGAPTETTAALDIKSNNKGVLFPKLTTAQRNAIASPPDGLTIYNTDTHAVEHYNSSTVAWESTDGLQSLNGLTNKNQLLTVGNTGSTPNWVESGGNNHTLNLPLAATSGVTSGSISNSEFQSFNTRLYPTKNVLYVVKNTVLGPQDFNSIKNAVDSIADNSSFNPYLVIVGPGVFVEDTITMKPYVWVSGAEQDQTVIQVNASNKHVIVGADNSGVSKVRIHGAGTGFAGVYYRSTTGTTNTSFFVEDVRFGTNDYLVISDGTDASTAVFIENCKFGSIYQFNHGFLAQAGGRVVVRNATTTGLSAPFPDFVFKGIGSGSQIVVNGAQVRVGSVTSGACIHLADGATLRALSLNMRMFGKAIWVEDTGAASVIDAVGILCEGNTMDIVVDHPGTDGTFNGSADHTKIYINPSSTFSTVFSCNRLPSDNTGFVTVGTILQGDRFDRLANLSKIARTATTLGVDEVEETDFIEILTGLDIRVAPGTGFLNDPVDLFLKEIFWDETDLTLAANSTYYVFVDTDSVVNVSPSPPDLQTTIVLGRVNTNGTGVRFIENSDLPLNHYGNKTEYFLRNVLGPVFQAGAKVSESLSNARRLDVTAASYSYGVSPFPLTGGSEVTFELFYHSSPGVFTSLTGQNTLDNTQYDNGSGLVSLTASYYAKHHLYALGGDTVDRYFVVTGQEEYATLADATDGSLPIVPNFISNAVTRVAAVIVQQGTSNVIEVQDIRPRIGFAAPSGTAITKHGDLSGLADDDHPQYLLVNGTRDMTGPLNMGGQSITNVNLIDGVDVSAHASRHLPTGADPLTTAAPLASLSATTTNATGTANSLSRSDHNHAITTAAPTTQLPDQANAIGSASELARADHVHSVPTAAPLASLSATTTNAQGVVASFSRSDHGHAILTGLPSAQTPNQANATGSSANIARADHIHNVPTTAPANQTVAALAADGSANTFSRSDHLHTFSTAAPSTTLSGATTNTEGTSTAFARADHVHAISTALVGDITTIQPDDTASAGTANTFARGDHRHAIVAAAAVAQTPDQANAEGASTSFARADHVHSVPTASAIGLDAASTSTQGAAATFARSNHTHAIASGAASQTPDQANAAGSSANFARADHVHNIATATPVTVGTTNQAGVATTFVRSDHVHAHGAQTDGTLHAAATTSVAGFMAATDKTKLNNLVLSRNRYGAVDFDDPNNADWPIANISPLTNDSVNAAVPVRTFLGATTEQGVGIDGIYIPATAINLTFRIKWRAQTNGGAGLQWQPSLQVRQFVADTGWTAWSETDITPIDVAANTTWHESVQTVALSAFTVAIVAGRTIQIEFTREIGDPDDDYTGVVNLYEIIVEATS